MESDLCGLTGYLCDLFRILFPDYPQDYVGMFESDTSGEDIITPYTLNHLDIYLYIWTLRYFFDTQVTYGKSKLNLDKY